HQLRVDPGPRRARGQQRAMARTAPSGTRGDACGEEPRTRGALAPAECQSLSSTCVRLVRQVPPVAVGCTRHQRSQHCHARACDPRWLAGGYRVSSDPSALQLLVYGMDFVWFVAVALAGYRWVASTSVAAVALLAYTGWAVFFSLATNPW